MMHDTNLARAADRSVLEDGLKRVRDGALDATKIVWQADALAAALRTCLADLDERLTRGCAPLVGDESARRYVRKEMDRMDTLVRMLEEQMEQIEPHLEAAELAEELVKSAGASGGAG